MSHRRVWIIAALGLIGSGCASVHPAPSTQIASRPTSRPYVDPTAMLSLEQIQPQPVLPTTSPSTQPDRPPLEALVLYAKARDEQLGNSRYSAINDLEKAIALDPHSFELNYALGESYLSVGGPIDRAIAAYEQAEKTNPNDIQLQIELGWAHQKHNDLPQAIEHYRLAMQTDEYRNEDPLAALVDYRLAVVLQQKGYDRAAIQCYAMLLDRLEHSSYAGHATAELAYLLEHPELIYQQVGDLCEKIGAYEQALQAWQALAEHSPDDFATQARVVHTLVELRRDHEALTQAADLVRKFHASTESIQLLRDVYQQTGSGAAVADALRKIYKQHPDDPAILFALADTLASTGKMNEAADLLWQGIHQHNGDVEIVQRLWKLYADRDQVVDAAKLIVRVSAEYPQTAGELDAMFTDLMRWSRKNVLRPATMQKLDVPANAQTAKLYWTWRAAATDRPSLAKSSLDQAAHATPPFDPACRVLLENYFSRADWDNAEKVQAANALIDSIDSRGRPDLANELRGLLAFQLNQPTNAIADFTQAESQTKTPSPDLQLEFALALQKTGNDARFEQLLWKLLSDRPRFEAAYQFLLDYYKNTHNAQKTATLIDTWLAADPNNVNARIAQAAALIEAQRGAEALQILVRLFQQRPDDSTAVGSLIFLLKAANQEQQAIALLQAEFSAHPNNRVAVEALVELYNDTKQPDQAQKVLQTAHAAVSGDPDLLYYIAHLYQANDQPKMTEQILQEVLKLDPTHAQAGNDLGYTWADEGKNLDKAEALIRLAVNAEPDNTSYLDSLGWVLYKRGKFGEALKLLQQACQPPEIADPIVLNHLGDDYYRLNRSADAQQTWQKSLQRLEQVGEQRDDLKDLRPQLQSKIDELKTGRNVDVAPVIESSVSIEKVEAKN